MPDEQKLYYGEDLITFVEDSTTPNTKRVTTEKGSFDVPEWEFVACASKDPRDLTELMNERAKVVVGKVLGLFLELDVRTEELPYYISKVLHSMENNEEIAKLIAFGFKPENIVDIQAMKNEVRMSRLDKIMKS